MTEITTNSEYVEKLKENTDGNIKIVSSNGGIWVEIESMSNLNIPDIPNWYIDEIQAKDGFVWVFFKYVK